MGTQSTETHVPNTGSRPSNRKKHALPTALHRGCARFRIFSTPVSPGTVHSHRGGGGSFGGGTSAQATVGKRRTAAKKKGTARYLPQVRLLFPSARQTRLSRKPRPTCHAPRRHADRCSCSAPTATQSMTDSPITLVIIQKSELRSATRSRCPSRSRCRSR
jgi:hypothetical protein